MELDSASVIFRDKLGVIDTELKDVRARLARLYDALETGKLTLDDLSPRIRELRTRQDELTKARVLVEAEIADEGTEHVDIGKIKAYVEDLKSPLEESDIARSKAFLKSFVKKVTIERGKRGDRIQTADAAGREKTTDGRSSAY